MKKICVTGGNGFLGSQILLRLKLKKIPFLNIDIKKKNNLKLNFDTKVGDINNVRFLNKSLRGVDTVIHLAAISDIEISKKNIKKTFDVNLNGLINLLEACKVNKIKKIIFSSSIYVSGNKGGYYAISKLACEKVIKEFCKKNKIKYVILRFGSLYGPGSDDNNGIHKILQNALSKKKLIFSGSNLTEREYIYIKDAAEFTIKTLENKYDNKTLIVTGNQTYDSKKVIQLISEILNLPQNIIFKKIKNTAHNEKTAYFYEDEPIKVSQNFYTDLSQGIINTIKFIKNNK